VNLYEHLLRQRLKSMLPNESKIDSMPFRSDHLFIKDLERLFRTTLSSFGESIKKNELESQGLQVEIDELGAELRGQEKDREELEVLFSLDDEAIHGLSAEASERQEQRKKINEFKNHKCPFGDIIISDCQHIQARQRILQLTKIQDAHAMKRLKSRRAEEMQRISEEKAARNKDIERLKAERQNVIERRATASVRIREQQNLIHDIENIYSELMIWLQMRDKPGGYEELGSLRRKLALVEKEIVKIEKELSALIRQHDENRKRIADIFSRAVRSVLSSEGYDGQVGFESRELTFHITHGVAMSGEAVDTLAVLLADITALMYNTVTDKGHLPGFLLHDSPREADLGIGIYGSYIRFVASLQEHFGGADNCPFQYIITTTTSPPRELRTGGYVKLNLNASTTEGLLLHRNIGDRGQMPRQRSMY
jgi:hypothetical protein